MKPENIEKTCCIANCTNTELNSTVDFFSFPETRHRYVQRNKWIEAIKPHNGPLWQPNMHSMVCGMHFVEGYPRSRPYDLDYVPSLFGTAMKMDQIKSRAVSVKKFALEYIKHDALLERPSRTNAGTAIRKCAYVKLASSLGIPVATARVWERRFRQYFEQKMANSPDKSKPVAGTPQWLVVVAKRLSADRLPSASGGTVSPDGLVAALAVAARARGTLCSTALYNDVKRALRISAGINDLHAVWVSAQRVSLEQLGVAGRAGDPAPAPPPHTAQVADLVLLHSDVDMHRLVTDESITLYEESAALHTLWQLVQRHRLEDTAPLSSSERAQRWTQAHRDYLDSGRCTSLVVLQRRWHELKLQARVRLAAHWRRATYPPRAPAIPAPCFPAPPDHPAPSPPPHEVYPRPAPIHISILKRYPHVATGAFRSWRQLVMDGAVVTEPLDPDSNIEETQNIDDAQSPKNTEPPQLDLKVDQPTVIVPKVEQTADVDCKTEKLTENVPKVKDVAKQSSDQIVDEPIGEATVNKPLVKQSTTGDPLDGHPEVDKPVDTDMLDEDTVRDDRLHVKPTVNEHRVEQSDPAADNPVAEQNSVVNTMNCEKNAASDRKGIQPNVKVEPTVGSDSTAMVDIAVKSTLNEIKVENTPSIDPLNNPQADQPSVIKCIDSNLLNEQDKKDDHLLVRPAVIKIKEEKDTDSNPLVANPVHNQTTIHKPAENVVLVDQSKVIEKRTVSALSAVKAANCDLSAMKSTVIQPTTDELLDKRTMEYDPLGKNPELANRAVILDIADTHDRPGISRELIHRAEGMSSAVTPRYLTQANASDSDSDTEDNLVIDEYFNNAPCSLNQEQIAHTETHSVDTLSLVNTAPTLAVLQMIDPSTVKTEIIFESDEEDFQSYPREDKVEIELDIKKEVSCLADKIMFADDEARVSGDVISDYDVSERMDSNELDNDTMDPQLLMDTKVQLFRIDKTRAWKNNVRKDKSIKVSRIHKRFYTPNLKKYYFTPNSKTGKERNKSGKCTVKRKNTGSTAKTDNKTSTSNDSTKKQEIEVHTSWLDTVADTANVSQLCKNMKREHIGGEQETPNKRVKTASDEDDDDDVPLLVVRENKRSEIDEREMIETADGVRETEDDAWEMVEESSSDEEPVNGEIFLNKHWDVKRKYWGRTAASTIEWNAKLAGALGPPGALEALEALEAPGAPGRVAKRVTLPDREQLRRDHTGLRVAQVAPITNTLDSTESLDKDSGAAEPSAEAVDEDTPLAWCELDLPAGNQLAAALDELTSASNLEHVMQRSLCCAARRHRDLNDARRRIGITELPLHTHADGVCTCCCAHLSDESARASLAQQQRALHNEIKRMLWKGASGKSQHSKPAQKNSRSPSPTSTNTTNKPTTTTNKPTTTTNKPTSTTNKPTTTKPPTKVASSVTTEAKSSKTKPATHTNRSKQRRAKPRPPTPPPAPPTQPVDYYEEWQRQKTLNAQYFHINSSFKKEKTATPESVAKTTIPKAVAQNTAQRSMAKSKIQQAVAQNTSQQSMAKTTSPQTVIRPSVITHSTIANSVPPPQTTQGGLMPYIRESRLIAPVETRSILCIEVPTLVAVPYTRGTPARLITQKPPKAATPACVNTAQTAPISKQRTTPRAIAPKPDKMQRASEALNTEKEKPETAIKSTNVTTEQVAEPQPATSQPVDKPLSILEEYSRTLNIEPTSNIPVVNALSLRVPDGPERSKTTILMALTLPSDEIIKQTINTVYMKETVDLTKEPDAPAVKTNPAQKMPPVVDIVSAVNNLISAGNSDRSLLKSSNGTAGGTELQSHLESLVATSKHSNKVPMLMSLSNKLHDGDIIEIDDSSDDSNDNHSSNAKGPILMNKSSNPAVYLNNNSNVTKSSDTKIANEITSDTDVTSNQAVSSDTNTFAQTTRGTINTLNQAINSNINKNSLQAASKTDDLKNDNQTKYSSLKKLLETTSNTNFNISNQSVTKTNEDTTQTDKETTSSQDTSNVNKINETVDKKTTLERPITKTTTSKQTVSKTTTSNQPVSKTTTSNQPVSKTTTSNQSVSKTTTSNQSVSKTTTSNQDTRKTYPSGASRTHKRTYRSARDRIKDIGKRSLNRGPPSALEAVELTDVAHVQALQFLKTSSERCPARFADVAAMPSFIAQLRAAALNIGNEVYTHKESAAHVAASDLACGEPLLCLDASRAPLHLPTHEARHLVLTDADLPCVMPTYWTLAPYNVVSRVVRGPDQVTGADGPEGADVPDKADRVVGASGVVIASGLGGARWCDEKGEWVMREGDKMICEQNHNFKVLTAFCSADGVRHAARAGAPLYLLHVRSARVIMLHMTRKMAGGAMRHHARADVKPELLRELEGLLDEAEVDEQLRTRLDVTDQLI